MRDYDIESDLKQEKFQHLKLVQGDRGNKIKINVYEDGQPVNLTGCSITAKYKRADGQVMDGSVTNISNNSFDAVIDSDITKTSGVLKMLFAIEKDDVKVSTFMLLADVREGIGESTGSSGGNTGGGEVTVDLSNYYKKSETYSKSQIDSQFKDITKNKVDKTNLEYINVLDLGIAPKVNFDNTSLFNDAINKGIKNFYFPPGIYELNLIISTPYIRIKGGGIGKTIFSPHIDKDVINLQYVDNSINNCEIRDIEIKNKEFTNNNGLSINGNDKGVNAINDNHYLKNLKISNFLNGIFIKDRTTFSKFENIEVSNNYNNGIRVDSINAATCFNGNGFYNIVMAHNINEGLYINTTRNGADFSHIALTNNFINCDVEDNANSENTTRFYGIYVTDVDNINLQGCYIENNAQKSDNGINLYFDGAFCRGINISGTLVWGSKYALKVTDKCKILSGEVSASNKIRGIIDINDKPHNSESGFIIGCALTEGYDNVKKLDKVLLANSSTTLNPFSIGISHDSTATPSVKRSNYITTFTSNEITNFTDGVLGQIVIVRPYGNAILTFNNGTYIQLKDNNTCTIKSNQTITFMKYGDKWVELFRNV